MLKEFAVISVPSVVINVADGQIESVFPTAELALNYIESEKPNNPDRRYGIRERVREDDGIHTSDTKASALRR
jgi:hypothetical protein